MRQRTAKLKEHRIRLKFADYLDEQLDQLTPWRLNRWLLSERAAGRSEHTIVRDLADVKALLNHAVKHGALTHSPLARWTPVEPEDNRRVRYLDADERDRLLTALDEREQSMRDKRTSANLWRDERGYERLPELGAFADHLKPMVLLALNTGLRRRELFELRWTSVNFDTNRITVTSDTAKSKRVRYIPMNVTVRDSLTRWREQAGRSALVFPGRDGRHIDNVDSAWRGLLKMAALEDFRWHDLRHDFASGLVMAGVDLYRVKTLLGHASITMTERYAHLSPEHLDDTVERLVR